MTRVALFTLIFLGVWAVFTAVFAASAAKAQVRLLPKWAWVILCLIVPFFGGLLYLMVGRPLGAAGGGFGGGAGRRQPKVVAPDDDPRFLRDLEKKLREQQAKGDGAESGTESATEGGAESGSETGVDKDADGDADQEQKPKGG